MPYSDVDFCIILTDSDKPFRDRIPDYLGDGFPSGMDVLPYTEVEFDRLPEVAPSLYQAIRAGREL